ncbi:MAG: flagellar biosynthesis protein FlgA [Chloroflexi bacterium]|nr:flagellar biosynthesis protein FlgA [Chloroflexota bacterium]
MFLSQVRRLSGVHLVGVADLSPDRARAALQRAGWPAEQYGAADFAAAFRHGMTHITANSDALLGLGPAGDAAGLDVLVEATGNPPAGIRHALKAFQQGMHVVMVNVEADALAGPILAERAAAAGVIYSLAYGDQPALICELVEWARASGFDVVCAGKGTKYLPIYHTSTPDTVWNYYGFSAETVASGDFNPRMFNSFLDGTKSAIEMAAVANATGLLPQSHGLNFPPCGVDDLPHVCRPQEAGGQLSHAGTLEVVSSLERDGRPVYRDLRWGVYVIIEAPSDYVRRCFAEYGMHTDESGRYAALYRPYHLIGLELTISVLRAGLRGEATGSATGFHGDVAAVSKRDLAAGALLDGEGGYCVYGRLIPAEKALRAGTLPIGLAHHLKLKQSVPAGHLLTWADVEFDARNQAIALRREMETQFRSTSPVT